TATALHHASRAASSRRSPLPVCVRASVGAGGSASGRLLATLSASPVMGPSFLCRMWGGVVGPHALPASLNPVTPDPHPPSRPVPCPSYSWEGGRESAKCN